MTRKKWDDFLKQIFSFAPKSKTVPFGKTIFPNASAMQAMYPKGPSPFLQMLSSMSTSGATAPKFNLFQPRGHAKSNVQYIPGVQIVKPQNYTQIFKTPIVLGGATPQIITTPFGTSIASHSTPFGTLNIQVPSSSTPQQMYKSAWSQNLAAHKNAMAHAIMFGTGTTAQQVRGKPFQFQRSPFTGMIFDDLEDDFDYLDKSHPEYFEDSEVKPPDTEGYEQVDE